MPTSAPTGGFGEVEHCVAEEDSFAPHLGQGVSVAEIGEVSCRDGVVDDDEGTVFGDADIPVAVGCGRLEVIGVVGGGNGKYHFKSVAVDFVFYHLKVCDVLRPDHRGQQ